MKSNCFFLFLFCCAFHFAAAQTNLVPNPSFEDTLGCPQAYPDLDTKCEDWQSFRVTPDYFHNCSPVCGYNNQYGYQQPHSGQSYTGVGLYHVNLPNGGEQIGVQLNEALVIGTKYYLTFYVSAGYNYTTANIARNKIGALFTTYQYSDPNGAFPLPDTCTIKSDSIVIDTVGWYKITGSFIADSAYQYLVIGSFFNDGNFDTLHLPNQFGPFYSYYYLDDVCLSTDSLYAENWWTLLTEQTESQPIISVYPNPASAEVFINTDYQIDEIRIANSLGQIVGIWTCIRNTHFSIPVNSLSEGLYYYQIKTEKGYSRSTFVVKH